MRKSVKRLKDFLQEAYIDNPEMDSGDLTTAVRDCLTDLIHICYDLGVEIGHLRMETSFVGLLDRKDNNLDSSPLQLEHLVQNERLR